MAICRALCTALFLSLAGTLRASSDQKLAASLRAFVDSGSIPCVTALVARPGHDTWLFTAGARDISTGDPVRRDTLFPLYSITKIFTAAAALRLIEEDRLSLDDPIEKFIPELAHRRVWIGGDAPIEATVLALRSPTVRDLLLHTAGYYYDTTADAPLRPLAATQNDRPFLTDDEFLRFIALWPLHDQPGTRYRYSNGYGILGIVLARAADQPLEEILQSRFFRPLGMSDTSFLVPESKRSRLARICRRDSAGRLFIDQASENRVPAPGTFHAGGGDLVSTADDLLRFSLMLLNHGELDGVHVLSAASVEQMTSDQLAGHTVPRIDFMARDTLGYGVGLALQDTPNHVGLRGAYGWTGNASTLLQIDPHANLVAIVLSQVRPGHQDLYRTFLQGVYRSFGPQPITAP